VRDATSPDRSDGFCQFRRERTVELIVKWKNNSLLDQPKLRVITGQPPHFLPARGYRCCNQNGAWLQQRNKGAKDLDLLLLHPKKILGRNRPRTADIDAPAHRSCIGARSVEQNSVERRLREVCISPRKFA
jgi:hypothetical protein